MPKEDPMGTSLHDDIEACLPAHVSVPNASSGSNHAHHLEEFGAVPVVHIEHKHTREEETLPASLVPHNQALAKKARRSRLRKRLVAERHLLQYFYNNMLYRTEGSRTIGPDELFLDLVIVGAIAALGHELRVNFTKWQDVEKFFLLFNPIISAWSAVVFFWNSWGVSSDLIDKAAIYLIFTTLTGIALGAHGAFDPGNRPYVAVCSFLATFIPAASQFFLALREPLLKNPNNFVNQMALNAAINIVTVLPYLVAAFVVNERAVRILYWVPFVVQRFMMFISYRIYRFLHRNRTGFTRAAVSIEHMVEKYVVLTMIVLGESVLGILFEGAEVVTKEGVRLRKLYSSTAVATAMLYALQTLYANVDNVIVKGGKHAIRYRASHGIIWAQLHGFYHIALVLFATGLGLSLYDIAIPPTAGTSERAALLLETLVRVEDTKVEGPRFGTPQRWLFSSGWGAAMIASGLIGAMHLAGPRAATKKLRVIIRTLIALGVTIGMPFSSLAAEYYLGVHAGVLIVIAFVEFVFVHLDRLGYFRSESTPYSSSSGTPGLSIEFDDTSDSEDSEKKEGADDGEEEEMEQPTLAGASDAMGRALTMRLCKSHCKRLVPVKQKTMRLG